MNQRIRKVLLNFAKKHHFFMSLFRKIDSLYKRIKYYRFRFLKPDEKLIVFESFIGSKYADSPRAIYEYMINDKRFSSYSFIWFFNTPDEYKFLENNRNTKV